MRQLQSLSEETAVSPTTTNQHAGSEAARGRHSAPPLRLPPRWSLGFAQPVELPGTTSRLLPPGYGAPRRPQPRASFSLSLPPHARCFLRRCPGARAASDLFQHGRMSCQPRARRTPEQVPRGTEGEWQRLSLSASGRPCHSGTWRSRWGEATENVLGEIASSSSSSSSSSFFFNRTWLLPPRSSRLRRSLCSLSKLFQSVLFFFSLQESGTDPNRPAPRVPSRYSTLNSGGGGLVAWTLRSSPAFPPRGEYCFLLPTLSFC